MNKEYRFIFQRSLGVIIMLIAFPIIPDHFPWYVSVLLFNVGLILVMSTAWSKLKSKLGITNSKSN